MSKVFSSNGKNVTTGKQPVEQFTLRQKDVRFGGNTKALQLKQSYRWLSEVDRRKKRL